MFFEIEVFELFRAVGVKPGLYWCAGWPTGTWLDERLHRRAQRRQQDAASGRRTLSKILPTLASGLSLRVLQLRTASSSLRIIDALSLDEMTEVCLFTCFVLFIYCFCNVIKITLIICQRFSFVYFTVYKFIFFLFSCFVFTIYFICLHVCCLLCAVYFCLVFCLFFKLLDKSEQFVIQNRL